MTDRVRRLRDEMREWTDRVCPHRARIVTDSHRRNRADSVVIRRAKALRDVLTEMPIYLREGDLIVGTPTSSPGAWIAYPELSLGTEQIVQMRHGFEVGPSFIRDGVPGGVVEYWESRNLYAHYWALRRECYGDATPPPENWYQLSTTLGHITPDFTEVLSGGLRTTIKGAESRLVQIRDQDPKGAEFLRALIITCEGAILFARRYGELALDLAGSAESPQREAEFHRMAEDIPRAMESGASSFAEALQIVWLCNQIMHIEGNAWSMSPGRVDQILEPYYRADIDSGALTQEDAFELAQCFLIKFKENTVFGPRGNPTQCITLGGCDARGADQTNDLTYLLLRAAGELRLPEPLVNLRWNGNTPDELMDAALECVTGGLNMPVFLNDEATPRGFINLGVDPDDAYDYTHVGCGELGIPGKLQDSALGGTTGHVQCVLQALNTRPAECGYPTFESFLDALGLSMRANAERSADVARAVGYIHERYGQVPFTSALMSGCIERARDLTVRADYNLPSMNMPGGFANFVNSVAAIRQLVYIDRVTDLDALAAALEANFHGHEALRTAARNAPKFGNDDARADDLIPVLERLHAEAFEGLTGPRNEGRFIASGIDGGGHINAGQHLGATPDGRGAGEPLAPGMAAAQGTDRAGLTALLNTVRKLDSAGHWFGGYTLNIRLLPSVIESHGSRRKLTAALRTYFLGGGLNLHFNCVSAETLRDAQQNPDQHRDLVVRVSGYSDHFTRLSPNFQAEIISRTEQHTS